MEKKITVCIQSFNHEKYLESCIQSLLRQKYKNFNIIVFDDGSTDNSIQIINNFKKKNSKIKLIKTKTPPNQTNFNEIFRYIHLYGDYFTIFHSDDIYDVNILKEQINFLKKFSDVAAVGTSANLINTQNKLIRKITLPNEIKKLDKIDNNEFVEFLFNYGFFLMTPSFMYRTNFFKKNSITFNYKNFGWAADVYFFYEVSRKASIGFINKQLLNYRISKDSKSEFLKKNRIKKNDLFKVLKAIINNEKLCNKNINKLILNYKFLLMLDNTNINFNKILNNQKNFIKIDLINNFFIAVQSYFKFKKFLKAIFILILILMKFPKRIFEFINKNR